MEVVYEMASAEGYTIHVMLAENALLTATATSQVISNVPAAVLLSGFTDQWKPLLQGVNIGGLGTPIASLASLITFKQYVATGGSTKKYLMLFSAMNFGFLAVMLVFCSFVK